ncbi:MAG: PKD domain-containing protein, partial [Thiotrichales bacterium]
PPDVTANEDLVFQLEVTDIGGLTNTDSVTISVLVVNTPPVADAGSDQSVDEGGEVVLDGSGSTDAEGDVVYRWSQAAGPTVNLSDPTAQKPTFTAPRVGRDGETLTFELVVTDDDGEVSEPATVNIEVVNAINDAPVAVVKESTLAASPGETVLLEESGSTDADGEGTIAVYQWTQLASDPIKVTLQNADSKSASFVVPSLNDSAVFNFELVVADNDVPPLFSEPAAVAVQVILDPNLKLPVADAGAIQVVQPGVEVNLDGGASSDEDGSIQSYAWKQIAGPTVALTGNDSAVATFLAPDQVEGVQEELIFELRVIDNDNLFDTDKVSVFVGNNERPVANAGEPLEVFEGETVNLDGSASNDNDGAIDSYHWSQVSGVSVILHDNGSTAPHFVAPAFEGTDAITLEFELTVKDDLQTPSEPDRVAVTVKDNGISTIPVDFVAVNSIWEGEMPVGFKSVEGSLVKLEQVPEDRNINPSGKPKDVVGLFDFEIKTDAPGGDGVLTVKFSEPLSSNYTWFKYKEASGWESLPADRVTFNDVRDEVTIRLTDGGVGDDDGAENGLIVDPSGPGKQGEETRSIGKTGGGGTGGLLLLLLAPLARLRWEWRGKRHTLH